MDTREQVKDALRTIGFTQPTMRMVRKVTRQHRVVLGPCDTYTSWQWKYHQPMLQEALRHALEELGSTYEAVRVAEQAFHGACTSKQVFANLEGLIREVQGEERVPPATIPWVGTVNGAAI